MEMKNMREAESTYQLAMKHIYGDGVPEDNELAVNLLTEAASAGHIEAVYNLGICYHYGYGTEIDLKRAYELYLQSAQAGYGKGMDLVGRFYFDGIYVEQDDRQALHWFMKAAESDDMMAVVNAESEIARCYESGRGVIKDAAIAEKWYQKKKFRELCDGIALQTEVKSKVFNIYDRLDFSVLEEPMNQLLFPETWDEGRMTLKTVFASDELGFKMLTCMLVCALKTLENYKTAGIPLEIFIATMKCFTRFVEEHKSSFGSYGFDRDFWTSRQLAMKLFRIGELEYELRETEAEGNVVRFHIPSDSDLRISRVKVSYRQAREFLNKYYPEYAKVPVKCDSWLLAPGLAEELPADSNILKFQQLFDVVSTDEDSMEFLQWLYGREDISLPELPEKTSLQRRVKQRLLAGGKIGKALGVFKKPVICRTAPLGSFDTYKYVVTMSRYQGKIMLSRHRDRTTWECQGGHIEPGETILQAAERELWEESGAIHYTIRPLFDYWIEDGTTGENSDGEQVASVALLAEIEELGPMPETEIAEVRLFDELPENLTYPDITPVLFEYEKEMYR
ncbi:MAG: DUF5596 domain-containing protein [Lachnospiraceae bacterium]|nr:DUF5596 domain-containing protein [Lachnospiraceae bacterium]